MKVKVEIVNYAGSYALKYEFGGYVLGRDIRTKRWKTRKGALAYAEKEGYQVL